MSGNGIRATRREKVLSKPLLGSRRPSGWLVGSCKRLKKAAHRIERRFTNQQLVKINSEVKSEDIIVDEAILEFLFLAIAIVNHNPCPVVDLAKKCRCVQVTAKGDLIFHKKL